MIRRTMLDAVRPAVVELDLLTEISDGCRSVQRGESAGSGWCRESGLRGARRSAPDRRRSVARPPRRLVSITRNGLPGDLLMSCSLPVVSLGAVGRCGADAHAGIDLPPDLCGCRCGSAGTDSTRCCAAANRRRAGRRRRCPRRNLPGQPEVRKAVPASIIASSSSCGRPKSVTRALRHRTACCSTRDARDSR